MKDQFSPPLSQSGPLPLWDATQDYIRVVLRDVQVEAHVGLHSWERHRERPTRLVVNVEMFAPAAPAPAGQALIDYDPVHALLKTWPTRPHVPLLETLAEELVGACFELPRVAACRVSVLKPDIFNDAAAVGVELYRRRPEQRSGS